MENRVYDRAAAVAYAHRWWNGRNPNYYNYDNIGGDCTNFVSQCLYAGSGEMNYSRSGGWYYIDANDKSPSWTGVEFLWEFLTGNTAGVGPYGMQADSGGVSPGDIVQLSFDGQVYGHTLIIVKAGTEILVAAHSYDCDNRPLDSYVYEKSRFAHILRG